MQWNYLKSFHNDKDSRQDYDSIAEDGVTLLGLQDEQGDEPFPGACGATHPALTQAVVKFQAKAYKELFPTEGPVRTRIIGAQNPQKRTSKSCSSIYELPNTITNARVWPRVRSFIILCWVIWFCI